jgi:hypothetical protein
MELRLSRMTSHAVARRARNRTTIIWDPIMLDPVGASSRNNASHKQGSARRQLHCAFTAASFA